DLMHFKRTFTEPFPKHREEGYKKAGIVPFHGHARFIGSNAVRLEGEEEKDNNIKKNTVLKGKKILVATGAKPVELKKVQNFLRAKGSCFIDSLLHASH
ncbi:MAG TPA: hypothetical protein VFR94_07160, partial [Nitrososphaeraceae archaeon]|nr:hypothetical protein [Nitrososphaeraceae archaeon]